MSALAAATRAAVDGYWAEVFGCHPAELRPSRPVVLPRPPAGGEYHGAQLQSFGAAPLALLPPPLVGRYRAPLAAAMEGGLAADGRWAAVFGGHVGKVIGPAEVWYADAETFRPPAESAARLLGPDDLGAVDALRRACDPLEWEHGGSTPGPHPAAGVFVDGALAALAGYQLWDRRLAHLSIVTHPAHRGRGHGAAAVAALVPEAMARGLVPQYRALSGNAASLAIARRLGFAPHSVGLAVRFR
ncbi:MAG TPA: GNAT family N-acetyltransferase [Longimicrobium sp.]|nr:GNAT family N-acetyltransferase [Longimicrobium sp.]